jgi:Transposase
MLPQAQVAVDLFHVVQLAVKTAGDVRRRAVRGKYGRRGKSGDPEYGIKNLMVRNLEHLTPAGFTKIMETLSADAAGQEILAAWIAKEKLRDALNLRPASAGRCLGPAGGPARAGRVLRQVTAEGVVVSLVDQVGFAGPLVPQPGQHPRQPLPDVGEVRLLARLAVEFLPQRSDRVAQLAVVDAQAADPVAQPGLGARNVGQQAVGLGGVVRLVPGSLAEHPQGAAHLGEPGLLAARRGSPERGFQLLHCQQRAVLVGMPPLSSVMLRIAQPVARFLLCGSHFRLLLPMSVSGLQLSGRMFRYQHPAGARQHQPLPGQHQDAQRAGQTTARSPTPAQALPHLRHPGRPARPGAARQRGRRTAAGTGTGDPCGRFR